MQTLRHPYLFSALLLLLCSFSAAWPWPPFDGLVVKRQDSSGSSQTNPSPDSTSASAPAAKTDPPQPGTITSKPTPTDSGSSSDAGNASKSSDDGSGSSGNQTTDASSSSTTDIDPRAPAGGIQMITPAPISGNQYYKIGDFVTFGWNYTSLSVTPSAIDIMASCSLNNNLYTIALNQSVQTSQAVTWDTNKEAKATVPLAMATYTLVIYDAAKGVSATPAPGYLGVYDSFTFGMYVPKAYTPSSDYQCASCSGAVSSLERQALTFMFSMVAITIFSFSWFVGGAGLL